MAPANDSKTKTMKLPRRRLPKVAVRMEHVESTLRAIAGDPRELGPKELLIAAGIWAHMEALYDRTERSYFAAAIVDDFLGGYMVQYITDHYNLQEPEPKPMEKERSSESETDLRMYRSYGRKTGNAKALFEAALAERLAALSATIQVSAT
jgi:hypothetical protein